MVVTPEQLKLALVLGFRLDHRDNLCTYLHQLRLGQHTSTAQNVLKSCTNQHQTISDSGAAPSLGYVATLTAPDGVSLLATLVMAWSAHAQLRVVLVTLFEPDHPTANSERV